MPILGDQGKLYFPDTDIQIYGMQEWELSLNADTIDPTTVEKWFTEPEKARISGSGTFQFWVDRVNESDVEGGDWLLRLMTAVAAGSKADCEFWLIVNRPPGCDKNVNLQAGSLFYDAKIIITNSSVSLRAGQYIVGSCNFVTHGPVILLTDAGVPAPPPLPPPPTSLGTVSITPSSVSVEAGQAVVLTAGYTGNAPFASFAWTRPAGSNAPVSTDRILQWIAQTGDGGTYSVTVTAAGSSGSPGTASASVTVTQPVGNIGTVIVSPFPAYITPGNLLTLTATTTGTATGINWIWGKPVGSSAPVSTTNTLSWVVGAGDGGSYTATATKTGASDSPQAGTTTVVLYAQPTIGTLTVTPATVTAVIGDTISLAASYTGTANNVQWSWSKPVGSSAPTSATAQLSWVGADADDGNYTVTATASGASDSPKSFTVPVTVSRRTIGTVTVTPSPASTVIGALVTLTAAYSGNAQSVTWAWTNPGSSTAPTSTTNTLSWVAASTDAGTYTATATNASTSDSPRSGTTSVTISAAGVTRPANTTYTQSSVNAGFVAASLATMANNTADETQATLTNFDTLAFVQADFSQVCNIQTIVVGSDYNALFPGGWGPSYTANADIESSTDGTTWTYVRNVGNFTTPIKSIAVAVFARYLRLKFTNGYVAATEFYALSPTSTTVGSVVITPASVSATAGQTITLTASISGNATDVTWAWTKPVGSTAPNSTTNVLTWTANDVDDGTYTATATSVLGYNSPQSKSVAVVVGPTGGIGMVGITPTTSTTNVGQVITLTASRSGTASDIVWSWAKPAGSTAPSSSTNVLTWTGADIDDGVYTVTATSPTAVDSPQLATATVTVGSTPGPAVWATGVSGITYSNGNRTATASSDAERQIKTTTSKSSGLWYTEITALLQGGTANEDNLFGLVVPSSTAVPGFAGSGGIAIASTRKFNDLPDATTVGGTLSYANGTRILRIALNHTTKKIWLGVDAAWLGGGDPAADTLPTCSDWSGTHDWVVASRVFYATSASTLPTTVGGLVYGLPAGFSLWDS